MFNDHGIIYVLSMLLLYIISSVPDYPTIHVYPTFPLYTPYVALNVLFMGRKIETKKANGCFIVYTCKWLP